MYYAITEIIAVEIGTIVFSCGFVLGWLMHSRHIHIRHPELGLVELAKKKA